MTPLQRKRELVSVWIVIIVFPPTNSASTPLNIVFIKPNRLGLAFFLVRLADLSTEQKHPRKAKFLELIEG